MKVEEKRRVMIKFSIPEEVYKELTGMCYIDVEGKLKVRIDKVSTLARECLMRGMREIYLERVIFKVHDKAIERSINGGE